ncbi:DUF2535 family protein [Metabacillus niabensis]|uniref:DUF2535 family protein n=1 Tax=Metabacillus niabensis TaxID=324854 RepID=A0ABT9Z896_9BACI|nr:DUF2535 family protein [Metabacillus niabensis]MDQ0228477.1 hypothetical protein [Metabacillus niabensis]
MSKSLEFKNIVKQRIKVIEIPVLKTDHHYYFIVQVHLQSYISLLYNKPQDKHVFSFREYLKRKMKWSDFNDLFGIQEFKSNA